jgi:hypothetical protein
MIFGPPPCFYIRLLVFLHLPFDRSKLSFLEILGPELFFNHRSLEVIPDDVFFAS